MRAESRTMVTSFSRSEETASAWPDQLHGLSAAKQRVRWQPAVAPCVSSRQHVPKGPVAARAHSAAAPARLCSRHPNTSRWCTTRAWQALAGGSSARVTHAVGTRGAVGATRRGSSMCPDRLILYAKCAFRIWCALTCAFRICPTENHAGIPPGCALTCALKNRAYGASVPAGGVCLQGQNDGI